MRVVDVDRRSRNVHDCVTDGWSSFGGTLVGLMLLLLFILAALSWRIRDVQDIRFHRFRVVMIVSFVWVVFLGVIAVLQATSASSVSPSFLFGMRSILLLLFASPLECLHCSSTKWHRSSRRNACTLQYALPPRYRMPSLSNKWRGLTWMLHHHRHLGQQQTLLFHSLASLKLRLW